MTTRLVPRTLATNRLGDDLGAVVTDSDAAKLEAVVQLAKQVRALAVCPDRDCVVRTRNCDVCQSILDSFDAALAALDGK